MFIPPEHIIPELRVTERFAAIRELLRRLVQVRAVAPEAEEMILPRFCVPAGVPGCAGS